MKCDVLVIGGGPAGLGASITASQKGLKTILVEKSTEIGYPVKTSAITWKDVLDTWKLPDKVMYQWYDSFFLYSLHSKKKVEAKFKKKIFGTLNYHTFLQELAFKTSKNGTKIFLSEEVTEPLLDGDFVVGAKTTKKDIDAKIVIDCSGPTAVIGKALNLIPKWSKMEIGTGMEYEMTNFKVRKSTSMEFYVGDSIVPVGYGWVFPIGLDRAKIGVSTVYNTPEEIKQKNIKYWLEKFISNTSPIYQRTKHAQPYEVHVGSYPLCGMIEKSYSNGVILAGDAAAQASMLVGEGIRYALEFGKRAAEIAFEAIKRKDHSVDSLANYPFKCKKYLGETFDVAADLLQVPTNEYWDSLVENIIRLKKENKTDLVLTYLKTAMTYKDAKEIFPSFSGKYLP